MSVVSMSVLVLFASPGTAAAAIANISVTLGVTPDARTATAIVSNAGPDMATNVSLTANLPAGIIPIMVTPDPACAFNFAGTTVSCSLGSLANGASRTVTIVVHPITIGTKTTTVQVSAAEMDPNPANNSASAGAAITEVGISNVQVSLFDAPDPIHVGQALVYVAEVLNIQDDSAQDIVVDVTIPPTAVFLFAFSDRGACSRVDRLISCPIGGLNPSQMSRAFVFVVPLATGYMWATAGASLSTPDPNPNNNSASARTFVNP